MNSIDKSAEGGYRLGLARKARRVTWLVLAWVICLALTVDFSRMSAGRPSLAHVANLTTGPFAALGFFGLVILFCMTLLWTALRRKWFVCLGLLAVLVAGIGMHVISTQVLTERSIREATAIAQSFVNGTANLPVTWADEVSDEREKVLSGSTRKTVDYWWSSPAKLRYDFRLRADGSKLMILSVFNAATEPRLFIWLDPNAAREEK